MREVDAEQLFAYLVEVWPEPPVTPEIQSSYMANLRGLTSPITCRRALEALRFTGPDRPTTLQVYNATEQQDDLAARRGEKLSRDILASPWADALILLDADHASRAERVRRITDQYLRNIGEDVEREPGQPRRAE